MASGLPVVQHTSATCFLEELFVCCWQHPSQRNCFPGRQVGRTTSKAGGDVTDLYSSVAAYMIKAPSAAGCRTGLRPASLPAAVMVQQPGTSMRERRFWHSEGTPCHRLVVPSSLELQWQWRRWSHSDTVLPWSWWGCKTEAKGNELVRLCQFKFPCYGQQG